MGGTWNAATEAPDENDLGEEPDENEEIKEDNNQKLSELKMMIMGSILKII